MNFSLEEIKALILQYRLNNKFLLCKVIINKKIGILRWLNGYENIKELSHIGKNPIIRYFEDYLDTITFLISITV